ncbi:MAG: TolC family protein [Ideonella sp.]|nr:TolC family protein [Ideonella sp.]
MDTLKHHTPRLGRSTPCLGMPSTLASLALALLTTAGLSRPAQASPDCLNATAHSAPEISDPGAARLQLVNLVATAQKRSQALGAAKLLADAASFDTEEMRASGKPQLRFNTSVGPAGSKPEGGEHKSSLQWRTGVNFSWSLYDHGRVEHLTRWRASLADAAQQGQISQSEQVALQTVNLALDRSRHRLHAQVWGQYAAKVCKLVDSLQQIVAADKGRGSELVQARKTLQQVQLSQAQARSQLAVTETRLKRLVGDELPEPASLSALLPGVPALPELQERATRAADIVALDAQAKAATNLAQATVASQKFQAGLAAGVSTAIGKEKSGAWNAGISLSMPILNPGADPAAQAARLRASAAKLQRDDALEALRSRLAEVHQQAEASTVRAREVVGVLRSSERVREDTLAQWQQLGRRSLFDVMSAEGDHFNLRLAYVDALHDSQQSMALLWSLAGGISQPLN